MYIISTKDLNNTDYEKLISTTYYTGYSSQRVVPEEGTYYYRVHVLVESIYKGGLSSRHYQMLQEEQNDFFIEGEEIVGLANSLKYVIRKEFRWRKEAARPYLKHTIHVMFDGEEICLNNRYDIDDIRIGQFIGFLDMLESAYNENVPIYFCRYTPPPSDWWT